MDPKSRLLAQMIGLDHSIISRPDGWTDDKVQKYNDAIIRQFTDDMTRAGFKVKPYNGRLYYKGVSVCTDEHNPKLTYQSAIRATELKVNSDQCGLDKIVYPALMQHNPVEIRVARDVAWELEGQ
jgi:hypothetical protein